MSPGDESLTIQEIARRLVRSESTIRYWRRTYRDLLGDQVDRAGHLVYSLRLFQEIEMLHRQRRSAPDVRAELLRRRSSSAALADGEITAVTDTDTVILVELRAMRADLAELRAVVDRIADHLALAEGD